MQLLEFPPGCENCCVRAPVNQVREALALDKVRETLELVLNPTRCVTFVNLDEASACCQHIWKHRLEQG